MKKKPSDLLIPVALLFLLLTLILWIARPQLQAAGLHPDVLLGANGLLFVLGLITGWMHVGALNHPDGKVFVRSVMTGMMIKMFSVATAVLVYVSLAGSLYHKGDVFLTLLFYIFYLAAEVTLLTRLNRRPHA